MSLSLIQTSSTTFPSLKEGIEKGREQGIQQGEDNTKRLLALNMLAKGLDPSLISEITGLTEEVVLALVEK